MQDELRRYGSRLQLEGRAPIEIRVGVNSGEVVVRSIRTGQAHPEYTPIGHTTNLAARLQAIARTGSIVVSENTRKLAEGYFQLRALGRMQIRGIAEPVDVYEVTGLGALRTRLQRAVGRGLTKFVGRERELHALREALELAKVGHGQIVATVAEPGIGKSRLYYEFKAISQSECMLLEAFSVSYGKASTYLPVIDLLRNYFDISSGDDERKRREKVTGRVVTLDRTLEDTLPYLFSLLGIAEGDDPTAHMDRQIRKRRTHEAIKRIVLRESLNQPLMLIFEDLHWMDGESEALLDVVADSIGTAKILLLVNYRPEYSHGWGGKTYYTQLRLDPLGRENAEDMLTSLLGDGDDLVSLRRLIIDKTEGTPFFMEETVQMLLDEGSLVRNGTMKLARSLTELKIPPTVQAILASRIDRLPLDEKGLLQTLAVVGREFPLSLVREVTKQSDDDLNRLLNHLQLGEFIYEQPAVGDIEYVFKHALTQEVAYNSVLAERRKSLHERTGAAVESLYAQRLDDQLSELARHYRRSTNNEKAVKYLDLAAQKAEQRSAYGEAVEHLTAALELLRTLPENVERDRRELGLQIALARSLTITRGLASAETAHALLRARELCQAIGNTAELFTVLCGLVPLYLQRLQLRRAYDLGQELLGLAQSPKVAIGVAPVHGRLGMALMMMGDLSAARGHFEYVFAGMDRLAHEITGSFYEVNFYPIWGTWALWALGYSDQAREWSRRALAAAEKLSRPAVLANAHGGTAMLHMFLLDAGTALEHAEADIAIAKEVGFSFELAFSGIVHGWALGVGGRLEEGLAEMRHGIDSGEAAGFARRPRWYPFLAELQAKSKGPDRGLQIIAEGLALLDSSEERLYEAELYRVKGELLLAQDDSNADQAESCFQRAINIARKQSAKSLQLRATASLARLLARRGRRDEANAMLAEIYNWFTEGFDTADLKEAKALLDELSA